MDCSVHTNGLENYWSLLKRSISGAYLGVEPDRYLDEQASRYNNRKDDGGNPLNDADCCDMAVRQIVEKQLTWDALTGKAENP